MSVSQPLPESLRPEDFAAFVGQEHLAARIKSLLSAPRLPSLLLFGPPGCGKSTLALLLAKARGGKVLRISAPEAGLQQLRRQLNGVDILVLTSCIGFPKHSRTFFFLFLRAGKSPCWQRRSENPSFSVTRAASVTFAGTRLRPLLKEELFVLARRRGRKRRRHPCRRGVEFSCRRLKR